MHWNREYGRIDEGGAIEYAPKSVKLGGVINLHPTAEDYALLGYKRVVDNTPPESPTEGWHYKLVGWSESGGKIMHQYALEKDPPPAPRVFSKLKCVAALMEAGVWHEVKGYIEGAGLYDLYLAAQDFREDNPYFVSGKAQLMTSLGWTEEQAEAILSQCVAEVVPYTNS